MMKRKGRSKGQRIDVLHAHGGACYLCGLPINLARGDRMEVEHRIPIALGGADDHTNTLPAHAECHAQKTKADVRTIAKAKRVAKKHEGTFRQSRNAFATAKTGKFKQKLDGSLIDRATGRVVKAGRSPTPQEDR